MAQINRLPTNCLPDKNEQLGPVWHKESSSGLQSDNALPVMIRTLQVMGLVPPQYVIASYRFRLFPLFPLCHYYPVLVLSVITHCSTCFDCVWLCPAL